MKARSDRLTITERTDFALYKAEPLKSRTKTIAEKDYEQQLGRPIHPESRLNNSYSS
ncbi:MAG: hypothetical protein JSW11_10330 [Candidatus Heimdallarchaeota archaeon]|nr:MAG: hypothetical protein JSW11_10330 [Candidatus Heimdallarchaeota archaeon]